jgi:hypothetical protein
MKLRNKKTGEIIDLYEGLIRDDGEHITIKPVAVLEKCYIYHSLTELNAEWEDYEEPKEYWCIDWTGGVNHVTLLDDSTDEYEKDKIQIGNYFKTRVEAEQAVERLKAWKRLKDKGFEFCGWCEDIGFRFTKSGAWQTEVQPDLDLLFGGEE